MMLSHVTVAVSDFDRALAFYEAVLTSIGLYRSFHSEDRQAASFRKPHHRRPLFFVVKPFNGEAAEPGNGPMVAFECATRQEVDEVHALALTLGAVDEGAPGLRPQYHDDYYGAYLRDTEGNKICFVCHDPAWVRPA
jgi:lactoylglutathione lyase